MKGQGTGLWVVAIALIGVFMLATMVAPALLNPADDQGGDGSGGTSEGLTFEAPVVEIADRDLDEDDSTALKVRTIADNSTTGEGGTFIWVLSVDGANGQGGAVQVKYGDEEVQWFGGGGGSLVGVGPRFTQGPGATPVEVSAEFEVTPLQAGTYTIKAWVALASKVITLDPSGLEARSPVRYADLKVNEKPDPEISVELDLSGPYSAREDQAVSFTLSSEGIATGRWNGSITDRIIIKKSGIRLSDVTVRVDREEIDLTDVGSQLEGDLRSVRPFESTEKEERAEWSVDIEITFHSDGDYAIQCSSLDSVSREVLATTGDHAIEVSRSGDTPDDDPVTPDPPSDEETPAPPPAPDPEPEPSLPPTPPDDDDEDVPEDDDPESPPGDDNGSGE